jgi:hypothetical protein
LGWTPGRRSRRARPACCGSASGWERVLYTVYFALCAAPREGSWTVCALLYLSRKSRRRPPSVLFTFYAVRTRNYSLFPHVRHRWLFLSIVSKTTTFSHNLCPKHAASRVRWRAGYWRISDKIYYLSPRCESRETGRPDQAPIRLLFINYSSSSSSSSLSEPDSSCSDSDSPFLRLARASKIVNIAARLAGMPPR